MLSAFVSLLEQEEDRILFSQIYQSYQRGMYAVALHFLHDPSSAEDAVQDVWVKIIEHFPVCKEIPCKEREFWIACIVKNTALNMLRHQQYQAAEEPAPVASGAIDDETGTLWPRFGRFLLFIGRCWSSKRFWNGAIRTSPGLSA